MTLLNSRPIAICPIHWIHPILQQKRRYKVNLWACRWQGSPHGLDRLKAFRWSWIGLNKNWRVDIGHYPQRAELAVGYRHRVIGPFPDRIYMLKMLVAYQDQIFRLLDYKLNRKKLPVKEIFLKSSVLFLGVIFLLNWYAKLHGPVCSNISFFTRTLTRGQSNKKKTPKCSRPKMAELFTAMYDTNLGCIFVHF